MNASRYLQPRADTLAAASARDIGAAALVTFAGMALYGYSIGFWRSPVMAGYVALKLPLLIFLTLACNGLLNGLIGTLLGAGFTFRQSLFALLTAFSVAALILGSLAPVTLLLAWNAPPPDSPGAAAAHASYLVAHTVLIAIAGIMANIRLHRVLTAGVRSRSAANATLITWLAGNGFLGAQFSWILRPFFGSPNLEVAFLRPDPMRDNFYLSVWRSLNRITGGNPLPALALLALLFLIPISHAIRPRPQPPRP